MLRRSRVDEVHDRLRASIFDGKVAAGERLVVDALARELGVSPTPLREALGRLESEGLVTRTPLRGWSVAPRLDADGLRDLYQLRLLLEPWAAGEAARRASPADVVALRAELATCPEAPADGRFDEYRTIVEHDALFHGLLLDLADSAAVRAAIDQTHCHLHVFRLAYGRSMGDDALAEHRAVVDAIATGNPRAASAAMTAHLRQALARLEAVVDR